MVSGYTHWNFEELTLALPKPNDNSLCACLEVMRPFKILLWQIYREQALSERLQGRRYKGPVRYIEFFQCQLSMTFTSYNYLALLFILL
jgi:hypothetical protein